MPEQEGENVKEKVDHTLHLFAYQSFSKDDLSGAFAGRPLNRLILL